MKLNNQMGMTFIHTWCLRDRESITSELAFIQANYTFQLIIQKCKSIVMKKLKMDATIDKVEARLVALKLPNKSKEYIVLILISLSVECVK